MFELAKTINFACLISHMLIFYTTIIVLVNMIGTPEAMQFLLEN